jgi:hypothetical protein
MERDCADQRNAWYSWWRNTLSKKASPNKRGPYTTQTRPASSGEYDRSSFTRCSQGYLPKHRVSLFSHIMSHRYLTELTRCQLPWSTKRQQLQTGSTSQHGCHPCWRCHVLSISHIAIGSMMWPLRIVNRQDICLPCHPRLALTLPTAYICSIVFSFCQARQGSMCGGLGG